MKAGRRMHNKIALGFHGCIDYECVWDARIFQELIDTFRIRLQDVALLPQIYAERDILISVLWHMMQGSGGEFVPESSEEVENFANRFKYRITIGGTAARAAIAIEKLGLPSYLQICCNNALFHQLLPKKISFVSSIRSPEGRIYPHVSIQYPSGCRIKLLDGSFTTKNHNRVLFSRDPDSISMRITEAFHPLISDVNVFLLSCYSEMLDEDLLKSRLHDTIETINSLAPDKFVFFEDGCYHIKPFRHIVHKMLASHVDAISMNEDEFTELLGDTIDLDHPEEVFCAILSVYKELNFRNIIIHSSKWALAYGEDARKLRNSLINGICLAATRFRLGDNFDRFDFNQTMAMCENSAGKLFADQLNAGHSDVLCCVPAKELSEVQQPTTVGLGDYFAGGLLAGMIKTKRLAGA